MRYKCLFGKFVCMRFLILYVILAWLIDMKILSLFINILIPHLAGIVGSYFTIPNLKSWYSSLNKPVFNPPDYIFTPVWLTLYTIIGLSFYLFHRKNKYKMKIVYFVYIIHIFLNGVWSIIFFGMHNISFAFFDICLIIFTLVILINYIYKVSKVASFILIPYLIWCCFAAILNYQIFILN